MNPWMPTLVTGVLVLLGVVVNYAILGERVRVNAENHTALKLELDNHKEAIWPVVTNQGQDIAKIKGHLGINGDFSRSKGHHV